MVQDPLKSTPKPKISLNWVRVFVTIRGKNLATTISKLPKYAEIGICTPLKSAVYFPFVSETIAVEPLIFPSGVQNLVKIGIELRT